MDFESIYRTYFQDVYLYIWRLSGDAHTAEEITSETFFRALRAIDSFRGECELRVWLCQIARNTYFAWYKQQKKAELCELQPMPDQSAVPEETLLQRELSDKAFACLQELEEPYKEVFLLSVFGELSFKQISQSFQKSESWARVTFYRAKQKLLEKMRD